MIEPINQPKNPDPTKKINPKNLETNEIALINKPCKGNFASSAGIAKDSSLLTQNHFSKYLKYDKQERCEQYGE